MNITIPIINIPYFPWKKEAREYAVEHSNIINLNIKDFCHKCEDFFYLLNMFEKNNKEYCKSEYFIYRSVKKEQKKKHILNKILRYKNMYERIKNGDYTCLNKFHPIVTEDGVRLDGTHRLSILNYIGIYNADVNVFLYENVFSKKEIDIILKGNLRYRNQYLNTI